MLTLNQLEDYAQATGFDAFGAARAVRLDKDASYLERWLREGYQGSMQYMAENFEKRVNPKALVPEAETVLVCLLNYYVADRQPEGAPYIAKSGLAETDYHIVMKERLKQLEDTIVKEAGSKIVSAGHQHLFCDSAPILERRWAQRAGLGWIGRNKQFIHPTMGSFVHIGILLINAELDEYSDEYTEYGCGECDLCIKKCPTGALRTDMFDARKCISYLTIERKEDLPACYKKVVSNNLYGCDICAMVCPYNNHLQPTTHKGLTTNPILVKMTREEWAKTSRRQRIKWLHRLAHE